MKEVPEVSSTRVAQTFTDGSWVAEVTHANGAVSTVHVHSISALIERLNKKKQIPRKRLSCSIPAE